MCSIECFFNHTQVLAPFSTFSVADPSGMSTPATFAIQTGAFLDFNVLMGAQDGVATPQLTVLNSGGSGQNVSIAATNISIYAWADAAQSTFVCAQSTIRIGQSTQCTVLPRNSSGASVNVYTSPWQVQAGESALVVPLASAVPQPIFGQNISFMLTPVQPLGRQLVQVLLPSAAGAATGGVLSLSVDVVDMPDETSSLVCDTQVVVGGTAVCRLAVAQFGVPIFSSWSLLAMSDSSGGSSAAFTPTAPLNGRSLATQWTAPSTAQRVTINCTSAIDSSTVAATSIAVYALPDNSSSIACPSEARWNTTVLCVITPRSGNTVILSSLTPFAVRVLGSNLGAAIANIVTYGSALVFNVRFACVSSPFPSAASFDSRLMC